MQRHLTSIAACSTTLTLAVGGEIEGKQCRLVGASERVRPVYWKKLRCAGDRIEVIPRDGGTRGSHGGRHRPKGRWPLALRHAVPRLNCRGPFRVTTR